MEKFYKVFQSFGGAYVQGALSGRPWKCFVCADFTGGGLRPSDDVEWLYDGIVSDPYGNGAGKYRAFQPIKTASCL